MWKEADGVFENMILPPQLPDLKPIELLWEDLDRKIKILYPTSTADLWGKLKEAWPSLKQETIYKLIEKVLRLVRVFI